MAFRELATAQMEVVRMLCEEARKQSKLFLIDYPKILSVVRITNACPKLGRIILSTNLSKDVKNDILVLEADNPTTASRFAQFVSGLPGSARSWYERSRGGVAQTQ